MKHFILTVGFFFVLALAMAQKNKLVAEKSGSGAIFTHEVQPSEGLYSLSDTYGIKISDIAKANGFKADKNLIIGEKVKIPLTAQNLSNKKNKKPVYYKVSSGETLSGISNRFGKASIKDIKKWNKIDGNSVNKGSEIIVGYFTGKLSEGTVASKNTKNNAKEKTDISQQAKITGTDINIRKGPATDKDVVGTAQENDIVDIIKKVDKEWVSVRTKDGVEGYMAAQFLQPIAKREETKKEELKKEEEKVATTKPSSAKIAKISGTDINIRKGPSTDESIVGMAKQDDVVYVIKNVNNEWASIHTKNGVEGYIASRFLTAPKTVKISGTNVNVRKGPDTNTPVVAQAQLNDDVAIIKNIDAEWTEIQTADGKEGFVATQFLILDDNIAKEAKPDEELVAVTEVKDEEVEEQIADVEPTEKTVVNPFKDAYEAQSKSNKGSDKTVTSGIFKTDRGWNDGEYYLLIDNAAAGSIVKITNPENNKTIYAKVLGELKGVQFSDNYDIRISDAAAAYLQTNNTEKFTVKVDY